MANFELTRFIRSASSDDLSLEDRCLLFRRCLALYLIYYYVQFFPYLFYVFGSGGMVNRAKLGPLLSPSLLFLLDSNEILVFLLAILLCLSVFLFLNKLPRWGVLALFALNLSFHNANPYIILEPQQISSLFLLIVLFFLPIQNEEKCDPFIWKTLLYTLGIYYFVAGFKKIIDPLWMEGQALRSLLQWDALSRQNALTRWIVEQKFLSYSMNYLTLFFELTFFLASFTRFFRIYWWFGILFHISIVFVLEVGSFSAIMFVWYALVYPSRNGRAL